MKKQTAMRKMRLGPVKLEFSPPVFLISAGVILFMVLLAIIFSAGLEEIVGSLQSTISLNAGWFYILVVNGLLLFAIYLLLGRYGRIRLGGPEAEPEFSRFAWLAMLFSAGMGIGLVFWSVAEPITHYSSPPYGEPGSPAAVQTAMHITFYHWGLHPWGIYAIVGVALAFSSYNRGLPLTLRSVFHPLLGKRIYGPIGHTIDIIAVVATLFGVATSLGFGVEQILAGADRLFDTGTGRAQQIVLIAAVTGLATLSVVAGLDKGVKFLSQANLVMAGGLMLLVFVLGPTLFLLNSFVQNTGSYLQNILRLSTWTEANSEAGWQTSWTVFYWGWWISWAPFVGMFIAQISRGRTIREFITGVLLAPTILTFFWMTVFGNTAISLDQQLDGLISQIVSDDYSLALFALLEQFSISGITSFIAVIVVILFFVTSSDSGSLVIDVITSGGHTDAPVAQRVFWATLEGVVAAVLMVGGGLAALQTAAIATALPFSIVMVALCIGLYKGLVEETEEEIEGVVRAEHVREPPGAVEMLSAPEHGRNWLVLDWEPPAEGGPVTAYSIRRRRPREEKWHEVAIAQDSGAVLHHREEPHVFEYQVMALNRLGRGKPSPPVRVNFREARA